jgi:hypothetical protein
MSAKLLEPLADRPPRHPRWLSPLVIYACAVTLVLIVFVLLVALHL